MSDRGVTELRQLYLKEVENLHNLCQEHYNVAKPSQPPVDKNEAFDFKNEHLCLRYRAVSHEMKTAKPCGLPINRKLLLSLAIERLRDQIRGSKETLEAVRAEKGKLLGIKNKLLAQLEEERRMLAIVKDKCQEDGIFNDALEVLDHNVSPEEEAVDVVQQMEMKFKKIKKLKALRMSQLSNFLVDNFPETYGDVEDIEDDIFEFQEGVRKKSLGVIIELLVTTHLNNALSWVTVDSTMSVPYVELLLRTGIAIRNKNNPSEIRLERFND